MRLEFEQLVFDYPGGLRAVDGVSGSLEPGEFKSLIGPNGAGKSTLVRLLNGLLAQKSGSIRVDGSPLDALTHRERARLMACVPQYLASLPEVRIGDFVLGGRYAQRRRWRGYTGQDRTLVRESLAACDAADLEERMLTRISGGQRQRVLIARALAQEAPILLVDEPTTSLDPGHQYAVFDLLRGLVRQGRSALVVTHDLNLASQFSTMMMLLDRGQVVIHGTPQEVLRPEILEPVYGSDLTFGSLPGPDGKPRPFVLPWR
ncbi:MAG: ABC transporter ATP-binding protein [Planctomycetota bacterium]